MSAVDTRVPQPTTPTPPSPRRMGPDARRVTARTVRYTLLFLFLVFVLIPVYVLLVTSFKPGTEATLTGAWDLPQNWTLDAWREAWDALSPSLWRSFAIAIPASIVSAILGSMNGFVFSRWRFPGSDIVFTLFLFGMFIPYQAVMIPLRQLTSDLGLASGVPTLIVVHIAYGIPICSLIFRGYYSTTIPNELVEAGRVDGAGLIRTYALIVLPLSAPGFVVTLIWQFTSVWNDFLFAIFLSNTRNGPVTIALNALAGGQLTDYAASMAGALIASFPTLIVYIVLGRWFIGGLMAGSLKT
ncbi:carbohydrate ABC transporter permease [Phytoactinopolyspora halotolerans]|uniref:Carbohydrate ABC transporter permease n=1 Tax=Phytoactinopolyspora halotolerans TaxID=1981512 RepID=A0A6L9S5B4_9ACTN|nr:carbohydrate ABC transporter permease [Phytoactinopolyspora halotolerans]NED99259.1 carbohydrate ABC transporter permease [Phytoactinopolyspora halotolerans]